MLDEVWRDIPAFPIYAVSDEGNIMNRETGRCLSFLRNQRGYVHVGLIRNKIQYKRSVALLVANAFVPRLPHRDSYNTPINLDGDRTNNRAANLMWRPLWFARKYLAQFDDPKRGYFGPIEESLTHEVFDSTWDAAIKYGLLEKDIVLSIMNRTYVVPSFQTFRKIE